MVEINEVVWTDNFEKEVRKIKDKEIKDRIKKQIEGIISNPESGKPLQYDLKGEKTIYIRPYRLIYSVIENKIYLLRFEHRKEVY